MQAYTNTDQYFHQICQLIAKANRTFVPKQADDSHTNLYFDPVRNGITGRWFETPKGRFLLVFSIRNFTIDLLDQFLQLYLRHNLSGRTFDQIELTLSKTFDELGVSGYDFRLPLHFEIPEYSFRNQPLQLPELDTVENWIHLRQLANEACIHVLGYLQQPGEIRIWPHHFDTGLYVEATPAIGIGFGLAMEDNLVGEPYLYLAGYGLGEKKPNYENKSILPAGEWVLSENWKGAVLRISDLETESESEIILAFLGSVLPWYLGEI